MGKKTIVKCISAGLALCIGVGLVTGCKNKTVNYRVDGATESAHENGSNGKKGVGQFTDASAWQDEWTAVNTKGNEVVFSIDAEISLPEAEQMYVVEMEEPKFDEIYKGKVVKQIFGGQEVYYRDPIYLPKKELEKERADIVARMDVVEDAEGMEELEKELLMYDELLEKAKDTYTPVTAYDEDYYLGERDGVFYELSFVGANYIDGGGIADFTMKSVSLSPKDMDQVCPEELKGKNCRYYQAISTHGYIENQCGLSEESALEMARRFVKGLEMGYSVYTYSVPLLWVGYGTEPENGTGDADEVADGYVFYFDAGMEQMSFTLFGTQYTYQNFFEKKREDEYGQYSLGATLKVYVTDKGVIGMDADNPIEITGISGETELLPLDAVEGIMKEQITEHFGSFRFIYTANDRRVECNKMELIYFRVRDRENPGHYSYVPAWRLCNMPGYKYESSNPYNISIWNQVLINAIDGSVIDFYDEV